MKYKPAKEAFTAQSDIFDSTYSSSLITNYKRKRVRAMMNKILPSKADILEINAGTGEDAIYFAQKGHKVHATELSDGMFKNLNQKVKTKGLKDQISTEQLDYHNLKDSNQNKYDVIFSNFGGLNCTNKIAEVLKQMPPYLKEGGKICLTIMPPLSLWEWLSIFKGNFKLALRRFKKNGTKSHIEGKYFLSWYHKPKTIQKILAKECNLMELEGLCVFAPPVHYERHFIKYEGIFNFLVSLEEKLCRIYPFNSIGDYYIIVLEKK